MLANAKVEAILVEPKTSLYIQSIIDRLQALELENQNLSKDITALKVSTNNYFVNFTGEICYFRILGTILALAFLTLIIWIVCDYRCSRQLLKEVKETTKILKTVNSKFFSRKFDSGSGEEKDNKIVSEIRNVQRVLEDLIPGCRLEEVKPPSPASKPNTRKKKAKSSF